MNRKNESLVDHITDHIVYMVGDLELTEQEELLRALLWEITTMHTNVLSDIRDMDPRLEPK